MVVQLYELPGNHCYGHDDVEDMEPEGEEPCEEGGGLALCAARSLKGFGGKGEEVLKDGNAVEIRHPVPHLGG